VATSGTVSTTVFKTRKVVDHAFRRCRLAPQEITAEHLETALDCLYLLLSNIANRGIPLWTIERDILALYQGQYVVACPVGTEDILNLNIRDLQRVTGRATASEGNAHAAFDRRVTTACVQVTPGGTITQEFRSHHGHLEHDEDGENEGHEEHHGSAKISVIGILPNASAMWSIVVETSDDGISWNPVYTNATFAAVQGQWLWVDLDSPTSTVIEGYQNAINFVRLRAVAPTVLNVIEFVTANTPREIPMALINKDDYANLPDHTFQGRPVQYWYDRQFPLSQLKIWPAADHHSVFRQLIMYRHRQIQDVGTLYEDLELPQRWIDAVIWDLTKLLCVSIKEVDPTRLSQIQPTADQVIAQAWNEETDRSPTYFRVNISPYTK
jgi:hypothetical protein